MMRVLGLSSYPIEAAATRFRMAQFVEPLRQHGIELTIAPFLDRRQFQAFYRGGSVAGKALGLVAPFVKRAGGLLHSRQYDLLFVQREAMFFGPGVFEWLYRNVGGLPTILDLDDATYVSYVSPSYGRVGSYFKFFGKTDKLIRTSSLVVCGNRFIADYARSQGAKTIVVPTLADTDIFTPIEKQNDVPILGWIGTHSTLPFLESIFPVLERLATDHRFKLKIVGAGNKDIQIRGVEIENREWNLAREISDFQSLDIGLYPIVPSDSANEQWLMGKSGFKAIQYLAVGVPFVMSPVGVCAEIGEDNVTHFNAVTHEDWYNSLSRLIRDADLRKAMGTAGRHFGSANYSVPKYAAVLAEAMKAVAGSDRKGR